MTERRLQIELWCRSSRSGLEYRSMVRRGDDYLFAGSWRSSRSDAIAEGNQVADKIQKGGRMRVIY